MNAEALTLLCIASRRVGEAFLREAAALGCEVVLLTAASLEEANWPWDAVAELYLVPEGAAPEQWLHTARKAMGHTRLDSVVALTDADLEAAALIREDLRLPGMGQSTTRYFHDRLAMHVRVRAGGLPAPECTSVLNRDEVHEFLQQNQGPWELKPRAASSGQAALHISSTHELWRVLEEAGERRSDYVLEQMIAGEMYEVVSITWRREVVTQMVLVQAGGEAAAHGQPFASHTLPGNSAAARQLASLDGAVLKQLGMFSGVTRSRYVRSSHDGRFYFTQVVAHLGEPYTAELMEYSAGPNPWVEWARLEVALASGDDYSPAPATLQKCSGVLACRSPQGSPDLSAYQDREIVLRISENHSAAIVLQAASMERISQLLDNYALRFQQDFAPMSASGIERLPTETPRS